MRLICFILLALSAITSAKEEDSNEVAPPRPPINLDSNLRRALLKALTELENEENEKLRHDETEHSVNSPHSFSRDKIFEKASASALSFYASTGESSTTTTTESSRTSSEGATLQPIVLIQKSNGIQHRPITSVESEDHKLDALNDAEQILTSASSSFTSSSASAYGKNLVQTPSRNLLTPEIKTSKPKLEATTATSTTTTTEESQAKVEDVQFFSAPLVAAFTVHQDEQGVPKSVEPIYRQISRQIQKYDEVSKPREVVTTTSTTENSLLNYTPLVAQEQLRQQLALQQKQKALENEILQLKQQQHRQNYLIRQQQLLNEQQLQLQRQKLLDEQIRIRNNQQGFTPIVNPSLNSFENNSPSKSGLRNDFNSNNSGIKGSLVSFQPSITLNPNEQSAGALPLNAQQLPVRNAVDFRSNQNLGFNNIQSNQFFRQQATSPLVSSSSNFNFAQQRLEPSQTLTAPRHNRVFRQESGTDNFSNHNNNNNGFSNVNYFNQLPQQQNRFFRSNYETIFPSPHYNNYHNVRAQPPVVNHHLNNLLYSSGVITKQNDDLNIISKVLSLNHLGGEQQHQRYAASTLNELRIPYVKSV